VHVLGHQDVDLDPRLMSRMSRFQYRLHCLPGTRRFEQRDTVNATESDEVQRLRVLKPLQAARHRSSSSVHDFIATPAHRDKTAMNGAQLLRLIESLMAGPPGWCDGRSDLLSSSADGCSFLIY
jgi:hypothetical protein